MWGGILYIIAGLLVGYWYWEIHYAKEYNLAKSIKETDDAAVCLFLLFLTIFWPISREDKINLENFRREIEIRKLIEEEHNAEFTEEFPLNELRALSVEGLEMEIDKILLKK